MPGKGVHRPSSPRVFLPALVLGGVGILLESKVRKKGKMSQSIGMVIAFVFIGVYIALVENIVAAFLVVGVFALFFAAWRGR